MKTPKLETTVAGFSSLRRMARALTVWAWKPILREYEAAALCGTHDIESVEMAFFNHDSNGSEPQPGQWEKRREQWRSFKGYLATHRTVAGEERPSKILP